VLAALLAIVAIVIPCVIAARDGALSIPRSDDWSYLLTLFRLVDHGRLGFNNWVSMTLVGQIALASPIALVARDSITAIHIETAVLGYLGLLAIVGAEPGHRRRLWLLAFTIALGPLWSPLAATFMTDVPAFAVQCVMLALALRMLRRGITPGRYAATLAVGFLAIAIRQYELIPTVAVAIVTLAHVRRSDPSQLRRLAMVTAALAVATAALFAWWLALPDSLSLSPSPLTSSFAANLAVRVAGFGRLIGLLLVPLLVAIGPIRIARTAWHASARLTTAVATITGFTMVVTYLRVPDVPFVGNYLGLYGVLARDVLDGRRLPVMPTSAFRVLAALGSGAAVVLAIAVVPAIVRMTDRVRRRDHALVDPSGTVLALTAIGFSVMYAVAIATNLPVFDRYALPLLPVVGMLLIRAPLAEAAEVGHRAGTGPRARLAVIAVALAGCAIVGLAFGTDSASFDGARWKIDQELVARGWPATRISGGFEWISWHARKGPPRGGNAAQRRKARAAYHRPFCLDVFVNPGPAVARRAIVSVRMRGLLHADTTILAVRNQRPCPGVRVARSTPAP